MDEFLRNVSFVLNGTPLWDISFVFFFLVAGFLYAIFLGRARLITFILASYVAIPLSNTLVSFSPPILFMKDYITILLYIITTFIISIILYICIFQHRRLGDGGWWQIFIASFLGAGFIISEIAQLLPFSIQSQLSESVRYVFLSDPAHVLWLLLPLLGIYIASR